MAKESMSELLKRRMAATQQASEMLTSDKAYSAIFQTAPQPIRTEIRELPIDLLVPFFTADIGFKPYSEEKLHAFAQQLKEEGILERIIVRPIPDSEKYEILAGHNRTSGARLAGFRTVLAEIVEADDARAIVIATATNLMRRQELTIFERGKAYKALLAAKNRNGQHGLTDATLGEVHQSYSARRVVAEFFGVTEHEIRKAVKMTQLIPELQEIMENCPKRIPLACADSIADYDAETQEAFLHLCRDGAKLNMAAMKAIVRTCPPPSADREALLEAWAEARQKEEERKAAPPKTISFDRGRFAPYIEKLGGDEKLEELFLEFLRLRVG